MSVSLLFLFMGSNALAQAWPERTEPGIDFGKWVKFSPSSLEWIRSHHLRTIGKIETTQNPTFYSDTEQWVISYSGDTLVATRIQNGEPSFIDKYDSRDTLRSDDFFGDGFSTLQTYDSCGRIVSRENMMSKEYERSTNEHPSTLHWKYTDNGKYIRKDDDWFTRMTKDTFSDLTYYGKNNRIDSVITTDRGGTARELNFYDKNNRLLYIISIFPSSTSVDSCFYYANSILVRRSKHEINVEVCPTPCLCWEIYYDTHGNIVKEINLQDRHAGCGSAVDTMRIAYEYDSVGRPVKRIDSDVDGYTTYQWMADSRPLNVKAFDGNGKLVAEEQYTYEF